MRAAPRCVAVVMFLLAGAFADDFDARFEAAPMAATLDEIGAEDTRAAADFLLGVAASHGDATLREAAVRALQGMRSEEAVGRLLRLLKHKDHLQRHLAVRVLDQVPGARVDAALFRARGKEKDPVVKTGLVEATRDRIHPLAVKGLLGAARHGTLGERGQAVDRLYRAGTRHESVRLALAALLKSSRYEDRILVLDTLGVEKHGDLVLAAARCLRHPKWQVRVATAEALARTRNREALRPLIKHLEREKHLRVRVATGKALYELTHENLSDYAKLWRRWWDERGATFRVPPEPPKPRKRKPGERRTVATFFGVPIEANDVVFVIDRSASMSQVNRDRRKRFEVAVNEVLEAVGKLDKGSRINVIFFGTHVWKWRKKMIPNSPKARADLEKALFDLEPGGGTYLYDALKEALQEEDVEAIYLLSDGEPSGGEYSRPADILREVAGLNRIRRAAIHCIAVGLDSYLLRELAKRHSGTYTSKK